jgi:uncharacterized Zn finger protein
MNTIPVECALCRKRGVLVTERIANTNRLVIHCMACGYVWNATEPANGVDRRSSPTDRRKASRTDRRRQDKQPQ